MGRAREAYETFLMRERKYIEQRANEAAALLSRASSALDVCGNAVMRCTMKRCLDLSDEELKRDIRDYLCIKCAIDRFLAQVKP